MAWTQEAVEAAGGSAEAVASQSFDREDPSMDYVMKLDHGDVIPFRDVYTLPYMETIKLGQSRGDGGLWRLGQKVCDWAGESSSGAGGSSEAVSPGTWTQEAVSS